MSQKDQKDQNAGSQTTSAATPKISRRSLLRSAAVGMPAMLTLHSGAALARSSNVVGVAPAGTRDLHGNALCLDTRTVKPVNGANQVDLGEPAEGTVNVLSERAYYIRKDDNNDDSDSEWLSLSQNPPMNADMICREGGEYFYRDANGWHNVQLPANGVIVSATAMVSVSLRGDVLFNRIA